jgi:peptidyl-prolyl cis-trans isomerase B (cyclophilin B)
MEKRPSAVLATLVCLVVVFALAGCSDDSSGTAQDPAPTRTSKPCTYTSDGREAAKKVDLPTDEATVSGDVPVTIETNAGKIPATLDADATPCTINSFVSLAEQGYFDGTTCHRLTTQGIFVLQCGDPTATGSGGPGYSFEDELSGKETYDAGTLAMANAGPDTNGSQFFLVYEDSSLPPQYTPFGTITAGLDILEEVAAAGSDETNGSGDGKPVLPVQITTLRATPKA